MARFIPALPSNLPKVNPHALGGGVLFVLTLVFLASIGLFGSGKSAIPVARASVPSLAQSNVVQADLRGENTNLHDTAIGAVPDHEPSLGGVSDPGHGTSTHEPAPTQHAAPVLPANPNSLVTTPIAGLTEPGPGGLLPIVGHDGSRASNVYARPHEIVSGKPVVALVVGGLGMMKSTTNAAISDLPPEVTLSFVPYTPNLQSWISKARNAGHEVLIELPMEPFGYPDTDPGPYTLLSTASSAENTRRLEWLLSRAHGYFGVTNYMGSKLTASENAMAPIFRGLNHRGIDFLYDGETRRSSLANVANKEGIRWSTADRIVDIKQTSRAIDDQLLRLEALAIQNGSAIGKGFSWPITIRQLQEWTASVDAKGYQLAPVSAVIKMRHAAAIKEVKSAQLAPPAEHDTQPKKKSSAKHKKPKKPKKTKKAAHH
jgi:polysaccharide deacetylase 2 family uncharacterized protein YibQ